MVHQINSMLESEVNDYLDGTSVERNLEKLDNILDDPNLNPYTAALKWPEIGVSENDYQILSEAMGEDFTEAFKDEVDRQARLQVYGVIPQAVSGSLSKKLLISKLPSVGVDPKLLDTFEKKNIIGFAKRSKVNYFNKYGPKNDTQLTEKGINFVKYLMHEMDYETTLVNKLERSMQNAVANTHHFNYVERDIELKQEHKRIKKEYGTLDSGKVVAIHNNYLEKKDQKNIKDKILPKVLDKLEYSTTWSRDEAGAPIFSPGVAKESNLKISDARKLFDLNHTDSMQSAFNLVREELISANLYTGHKGDDNVTVLGEEAAKLMMAPEFKQDWLDLTPEIRRSYSANGFCPLGIENKEECEQTWKKGNSLLKLQHKDVDGVRVELSSQNQSVFFFPRTGKALKNEDLVALCNEIGPIFREQGITKQKKESQNGFTYEVEDGQISFTHTGSRFIPFKDLKQLVAQVN